MAEKGDSSDEEPTIAEEVVVTKYKMAGEIATRTLQAVLSKACEGAVVLDLCVLGDSLILEESGKIYKREKEMKKGIAFPTCVSLNNCVCHYSPLRSDPPVLLKNGDMCKIELGVHVDGFIATVAHTVIIGSSKDNKVTGRQADVMMAAHLASEVVHRMMVPSGDNMAVTDAIQKTAQAFECLPCEGIISHQLKRNSYTGEKAIILNPSEQQRREHKRVEFELNEVYAVDIIVSSGEGKTRQMDTRTTVYRKTDEVYSLKMKASRGFFSEISSRFTMMPFSLRACEDEGKSRMGVVECLNHRLVEPFNVLYEREGEYVAQFKYTVLLLPKGPIKITTGPFDEEAVESSHSLDDPELKTLLASSAVRKAKKKKKKVKPEESKTEESVEMEDVDD